MNPPANTATILDQAKANLDSSNELNLSLITSKSTELKGGQNVHFLSTRDFNYTLPSPMLSLFFSRPAEPVYMSKAQYTFNLPAAEITDLAVGEGDCPVDVNYKSYDAIIPIATLWPGMRFTRRAITMIDNKMSMQRVGNPETPNKVLDTADKHVTSQLFRDLESKAITGTPGAVGSPLAGTGITGINFWMRTVNGATPVNTTTDNDKYNTSIYTSSQTEDAVRNIWAFTIKARMQGATHFTILIPLGSWPEFSRAWNVFASTTDAVKMIAVALENNKSAEPGSRGSIYADAAGKHYIDPFTDVVEVGGLANGQVYAYPDTVGGTWGFQQLAFGHYSENLDGSLKAFHYASSEDIFEMVGISKDAIQSFAPGMLGAPTICDGYTFSRRFEGQLVYANIGFAKMWNGIQGFVGVGSAPITTPANGTVFDLSVA